MIILAMTTRMTECESQNLERRVNSCVTSDSETAYTEASLHGHDTTWQSAVYHQIPITAQFTEQEPVVFIDWLIEDNKVGNLH